MEQKNKILKNESNKNNTPVNRKKVVTITEGLRSVTIEYPMKANEQERQNAVEALVRLNSTPDEIYNILKGTTFGMRLSNIKRHIQLYHFKGDINGRQ